MTKPFDLEAAKRGEPVQTRDGRKVRLLCFDRKNYCGWCIVGCTLDSKEDEDVRTWELSGRSSINSTYDLVMAPVKRSRVEWVNVYRWGSSGYLTKEEADDHESNDRIACIPVTLEWEE